MTLNGVMARYGRSSPQTVDFGVYHAKLSEVRSILSATEVQPKDTWTLIVHGDIR